MGPARKELSDYVPAVRSVQGRRGADPKELEGIWEGKIKVAGGIELRLALKVEKGKDGALKAVLASPDQGVNNIPISAVGLKDDSLTF